MRTQLFRERVEAAVGEEVRTGRLATILENLFEELRQTRDPEAIRRLLDFITRYVRAAPDILEAVSSAAKDERVLTRIRPVVDAATSYWDMKEDVIPDDLGLLGLTDDAYFSHSLMHRVATTYEGQIRVPLLSANLHESNRRMQKLFGTEIAATLDDMVEATMQRRPIQRAIKNLEDWRGTLDLRKWAGLEAPEPPGPILHGAREEYLRRTGVARRIPTRVREDVKDGHIYRVWYATNRNPKDPGDLSQGFDNAPDSEQRVHYGTCSVFVPKSHKPGSMGTRWWKRWIKLQFRDDHLKLTAQQPISDAGTFFGDLREELAALAEESDRQILVYIHGYSISFNDAALRAAQIGFDLNFCGETAFFSWPSCARTKMYLADGNRIENSELEIAEFLTRIVKETDAEVVHIIAHSLGNRGLARAASRVLADAGVRFGNIILAAPDVQQKLFKELAPIYPEIADQTTLYASRHDRALKVSEWLQDAPRAGFTPPLTIVPGIDTIEVTQFNLLDLGHGYWAEAQEVVTDIYQLLRYNAAPPRMNLEPATADEGDYWTLGHW